MENSASAKDKKVESVDNNPNFEEPQYAKSEDARYWQDSHQILSLLPPEVWDYICSFLDREDILNLNNSSLYFRELLLRKQVLFLYKPVVEILLDNLGSKMAESCLMPSLIRNRLVCKAWKKSFDEMASKCDSHKTNDNKVAKWVCFMKDDSFFSKRKNLFCGTSDSLQLVRKISVH